MKKVLLSIFMLIIVTGCTTLENSSIDSVISKCIDTKYELVNHNNRGYKYYIPDGLTIKNEFDYNGIFKSKYYDYYLYVDLISYYNKTKLNYTENKSLYFSKKIEHDNKIGIVNIEKKDDLYYVTVSYNYATIESKTKETALNETIANMLIITNSIKYNDDIIKTIVANGKSTGSEEQVNIFKGKDGDSGYLDVADDVYTGNEDDDYDPYVIN